MGGGKAGKSCLPCPALPRCHASTAAGSGCSRVQTGKPVRLAGPACRCVVARGRRVLGGRARLACALASWGKCRRVGYVCMYVCVCRQ